MTHPTTHQITIGNTGHRLTANPGETILQAAMREALILPYGCRDGACGSCKGKLLEGSIDYCKYSDKALTDAQRKAGDIRIRTLPCRVQKIERPTDDVAILHLKLPANERLQFLGGQYLDILLKDGTRR